MEYPLKDGVPEYVGDILKALESQRDLNDAWTRLFEAYNSEVEKLWADRAELRDELHALVNRVETLTRARLTEPAETAEAMVSRSRWHECSECGAAIRVGASDGLIHDVHGLHTCSDAA